MRSHPVSLHALLIVAATFVGCSGDDIASPGMGALEVTTSSSGPGADSDGYTIRLDGVDRGTIAGAATLELTDVAAGDHTLELGGVASACAVADGPARQLQVTAGETAEVAFTVACSVVTGSMEVVVSTSGGSLDPDGYEVSLDGRPSGRIEVNGNLTIPDLASGNHAVALSGLAFNCHVADGDGLQRGKRSPGHRGPAGHCRGCTPLAPWRVVFQGIRPGADVPDHVDKTQWEVFAINPDGSGLTDLSRDGLDDVDPALSPDHHKVAFAGSPDQNPGILIVNVDGTGLTRLTAALTPMTFPVWSPDGTGIAFIRGLALRVINADGAGELDLPLGQEVWPGRGLVVAGRPTSSRSMLDPTSGIRMSGSVTRTGRAHEPDLQPRARARAGVVPRRHSTGLRPTHGRESRSGTLLRRCVAHECRRKRAEAAHPHAVQQHGSHIRGECARVVARRERHPVPERHALGAVRPYTIRPDGSGSPTSPTPPGPMRPGPSGHRTAAGSCSNGTTTTAWVMEKCSS